MRGHSDLSYALYMELKQKVNNVDMTAQDEMLAEIADGNGLAATYDSESDTYAVWVEYPNGNTSMAPIEDVTKAEIDAVLAQHPTKLTVREEV